MKKILLLLVGAIVAFAAQAHNYDGYWVKLVGLVDNWKESNDSYQSQLDANGYCKLENVPVGTQEFKIVVYNGYSNSWYSTGGSINQDTWLNTATTNKGNMSISGAGNNDKFNVEFECKDYKIRVSKVEGNTGGDEDNTVVAYSIAGTIFDDGDNWEGISLTKEGNNYVLTANFKRGSFGIKGLDAKGNQKQWIAKDVNLDQIGKAFTVKATNDINVQSEINGNYKFVFDPKNMLVWFEEIGQGGDIPVNPDGKPDALYFHVKYDIDRHGEPGAPWVWLYNRGTDDNIHYKADDSHRMMVKVDEVNNRYSLWKVELKDGDLENYNACAFYFTGKGGNYNKVYRSATYKNNDDNVENYEYKNGAWAKYIYATASKKRGNDDNSSDFAVQSYLTYKEFAELDQLDIDNGGRRNIYLTGNARYNLDAFNVLGQDKSYDDGTVLSYNPMESTGFSQDEGCFYIPVKGAKNGFKISWIDTKAASENVNAYNHNNDRAWATFDLGLIGVNKDSKYVRNETEGTNKDLDENVYPTYNGDIAPNGKLYFTANKSVEYMNYNQADWVLPNDWIWRCLIIDTHIDFNNDNDWHCKTATLTTFNPMPTLTLSDQGINKYDGSVSGSEIYDNQLAAGEVNGHPVFTDVNHAHATAAISATSIGDLANLFTRTYYLYSNKNIAGKVPDTENLNSISVDRLPLSDNNNMVSIRAEYEDKVTHLTFHSRTSSVEFSPATNLKAPELPELKGTFVHEGVDAEGNFVWGVLVEGLDVQYIEDALHGFADFKFTNSETGEDYKAELLHSGSTIVNLYNGLPTCSKWNSGNNWSAYLRENAQTHTAPVYIPNVANAPWTPASVEINFTVYSVYPFLYNPDTQLTTGSKAPSLRANGVDHVALYRVPSESTFTVTSNEVISGVENVAAETENAPAEYYTISGVRVQGQPAPGLYIVRQGNKVSKVIVR